MGKTTISFDLSPVSIEKAIRELNKFKRDFQTKCDELARRIAQRIAEEAQSGFNRAIVDDLIGKNASKKHADVSVKAEKRGDYYVVVAYGEDAVWVEFGAGVYHNGSVGSQPNPLAKNVTDVPNTPISIGTFGKNGRKQAWGFYEDGVLKITHGTPAQMPMYKAIQRVSGEIPSIAKEVFQ